MLVTIGTKGQFVHWTAARLAQFIEHRATEQEVAPSWFQAPGRPIQYSGS